MNSQNRLGQLPATVTDTELAAETPSEPTAGCLPCGGRTLRLPENWVAAADTVSGRGGELNANLTPLQQLIHEILRAEALPTRPVKEWRRLYKSFFGFFAPEGNADQTERKAWEIATQVFNTNLVAVSNRLSQVVPMTFQDFVDGGDSFRHDGLRESAQRDIAWQPKKILLLMASMIGRVIAGWQADAVAGQDLGPTFSPFRNYLIATNRKASFLESTFEYDPRFSIMDYGAAGLKPLVKAFPQFAFALMENGLVRCAVCPARTGSLPPLLRAHFLKPLRAPMAPAGLFTLYFVLLQRDLAGGVGGRGAEKQNPGFEFSETRLRALAFESSDESETKCARTEQLFELALTGGLIVCGPHRPDLSTAEKIGRALGRTSEEQFVVQRFFALGFKSGQGNEPWLQNTVGGQPELVAEKIKKARKQFGQWKSSTLLFIQAGQPQARELPGASIRHQLLQAKGQSSFLTLLHTPVYAPLMRLFLTADARGKWLVEEPDLYAAARRLRGDTARVLLESGEDITRGAQSFEDREGQAMFLFECAVGILSNLCGASRAGACPEGATAAMRAHYERSFGVSLSRAPTLRQAGRAEREAELAEAKTRFEQAEQTILALLAEPLSKKISGELQTILDALPQEWPSAAEQSAPCLRLESREAFRGSINELCTWLRTGLGSGAVDDLFDARPFLAACAGTRKLAEEGQIEPALAKLSALYPALSEARKQAVAPVFGELAWSLLQAVEQEFQQGNIAKATQVAERALAIVQATPFSENFKNLVQTLFGPQLLQNEDALPAVPTGSSLPPADVTRAQQAESLLRLYGDELNLPENQLERDFLQAVRDGSEADFKRKEKLYHRVKRRTRWGGREPYRMILQLLGSVRPAT